NEALAKLTAPGEPFELIETDAIGRHVRVFKNAPRNTREIFAATRSNKEFLAYEGERLTYEETWQRAATLAHALISDYGVKKGDRVAVSMRNYPEWIISYMAVSSIGAMFVAMNALWSPEEMDYGLRNAETNLLIADQERLDRLAAIPNPPKDLAIIGVRTTKPLPARARAWSDVVKAPFKTEMPNVEVNPDDDLQMLFTSGSTGHPKGAVSTHRNVISALLSWELDLHAAWETELLARPPADPPQSVMLLAIPLFHVTGLLSCYMSSYRYQRRIVMMYKWDVEKGADIIEREGVTHMTATPAITGDLVAYARQTGRKFPTLVTIGGGGAARAPEQVRAIDAVFEKAFPGTGWGMTETNAIGVGIAAGDYLRKPESSGRVSAVLDIRIVDEKGKRLPTGQRGELQIRGTSIMREYWRRPDANAKEFVDGDWFKTGDVAYVDDEGFVFIVDRIKDLVIRGGENIGCGAVENALQEHPAVAEACVYGVPDERLGEEVAATLYVTKPVSEAELRTFLETRLAKFQIPRYFHMVTAPLPRGATGKIMKRDLRTEATKRLTEKV
ncbi:MAG TPA: class I adenylate-forming enzyme family protein, partial [Hyphomonadaceae bacterium]|nr:class I adenylate-forming enzyme family protein [Hyphomonadaceae bacterium]